MFYGWVVVGSGFFMGAIGLGARYSYGVFLKTIGDPARMVLSFLTYGDIWTGITNA